MPYEKHTWLRGETITAENLNHLEDGIVGEQTTRASQDQLINERIDQVIAPTGEAPNPTEITDARIGEDGTVYNTLGTAIRTQVGDLKNAISDTTEHTRNLWPLAYDKTFINYLDVPLVLNANTYTITFEDVVTDSGYNNVRMELYDANGDRITLTDLSVTNPTERTYLPIQISQAKRIFSIPVACASARIYSGDTASHSTGKTATWKKVQIEVGTTNTAYVNPYTSVDLVARDKIDGLAIKKMTGKKIVCFGDSIFGNYVAPNDIPTFLSALTGAECINVGFGGTRMTDNSSYGAKGYFSMCKLANAIASNDFSEQDTALPNIEDEEGLYASNLAKLKAINFANVDIITMEQATNDWYGNTKLTEEGSSSNLVYDVAMRYVIDTIMTAYPNLQIVIISPIYRWFSASSDSNTYENTRGDTLVDFRDKMQQIAHEYNCWFIDDYYIGINKYNHAIFLEDGTHPTEAGRKLISSHIANEIF